MGETEDRRRAAMGEREGEAFRIENHHHHHLHHEG